MDAERNASSPGRFSSIWRLSRVFAGGRETVVGHDEAGAGPSRTGGKQKAHPNTLSQQLAAASEVNSTHSHGSLNRDIWPALPQAVVFPSQLSEPVPLLTPPADWTTSLGVGLRPSPKPSEPRLHLQPPPRKHRALGHGTESASRTEGKGEQVKWKSGDGNKKSQPINVSATRKRRRPNLSTYADLARQEIELERALQKAGIEVSATFPPTSVLSGSQNPPRSTLVAGQQKHRTALRQGGHASTPSSSTNGVGGARTHSSASTHRLLHSPPTSPLPSVPPAPRAPLPRPPRPTKSKVRARRRTPAARHDAGSPDSVRTQAFGGKAAVQHRYSHALLADNKPEEMADRPPLSSPEPTSSSGRSPSLGRRHSSPSLSGHLSRPSCGSSAGYAGGPESIRTRGSDPHLLVRRGSEGQLRKSPDQMVGSSGWAPATIEEGDEAGEEGLAAGEDQGRKRRRSGASAARQTAYQTPARTRVDNRPWEYQVAERLLLGSRSSGQSPSSPASPPSSFYHDPAGTVTSSTLSGRPSHSLASSSSRSRGYLSPQSSPSFASIRSGLHSLRSGWSHGLTIPRPSTSDRSRSGAGSVGSSSGQSRRQQRSDSIRLLDRSPLSEEDCDAVENLRDISEQSSSHRSSLIPTSLLEPRMVRLIHTPELSPSPSVPGLMSPDTNDSSSDSEFSWYDAQDDLGPAAGELGAHEDGNRISIDVTTVKRSSAAAYVFDASRKSESSADKRSSWLTRTSRLISRSPSLAPTTAIPMPLSRRAQQQAEEERADESPASSLLDHAAQSNFSVAIPMPTDRIRSRAMFRASMDGNFLSQPPRELQRTWRKQQKRLSDRMAKFSATSEPVKCANTSAHPRGHSYSLSSPSAIPGGTSHRDVLSVSEPPPSPSAERRPFLSSRPSFAAPTTYLEENLVGPRVLRPRASELWRSMWSATDLSPSSYSYGPPTRSCMPTALQLVPPNAWLFVFGFLFPPLWYIGCFYPRLGDSTFAVRWAPTLTDDVESAPEMVQRPGHTRGGPLSGWPARSQSQSTLSDSTHVPSFDHASAHLRTLGGFWSEVAPRVDVERHQQMDAPMWAYQRAVYTWRLRCRVIAVIFTIFGIISAVIVAVLKSQGILNIGS